MAALGRRPSFLAPLLTQSATVRWRKAGRAPWTEKQNPLLIHSPLTTVAEPAM